MKDDAGHLLDIIGAVDAILDRSPSHDDIVSSVAAEHVQPLRQQISAILEEME